MTKMRDPQCLAKEMKERVSVVSWFGAEVRGESVRESGREGDESVAAAAAVLLDLLVRDSVPLAQHRQHDERSRAAAW